MSAAFPRRISLDLRVQLQSTVLKLSSGKDRSEEAKHTTDAEYSMAPLILSRVYAYIVGLASHKSHAPSGFVSTKSNSTDLASISRVVT